MIYFDNAASTYPKPPGVIRAIREWLEKNGANPGRSGHASSMKAAELIYDTRVALGETFGMSRPENVILTPGATYALNTVLLGVFRPGDHVIITDLEHNSVIRPLWHLQKKGVSVSVVRVCFEDDDETVRRIRNALRKETRAIVCTQCSNVCGFCLPLQKISAMRPSGVLLIVDGAQGAGVLPVNVEKDGIDYYCAPSHKGLMGPQGGGVLIVNSDSPLPLVFGGTGTETLNPEQPSVLPERLESGTLATPICAGMLAGIAYLRKRGMESLLEEKRALTRYAYERFREIPGMELYMHDVREKCVGVIPFNLQGLDSYETADFLNRHGIAVRAGLHCAPLYHLREGTERRGMVRVSFGCFNTMEEIDQTVKILKLPKKL